ncbi:MAG: PAS domain-containing sensor histidine kinase [Flavobacteriales bacterium]
MTTKIKFSLLITLIHLALGGLCYLVLEKTWLFIGAQVVIACSFYLCLRFFFRIDGRFRHLIDCMTEFDIQDTNARITLTGNRDLDRLINTYNTLLSSIRQERLRLEGQGQFLEELIAGAHVGVIIADIDGRITEVNPAAATFLNTPSEALFGKRIQDFHFDATHPNSTVTVNGRRLKCAMSRIRYKGFYRQFVVLEDLTAELLANEKDAYGRVIRMMSHEVNNSTGAVNSILQTLREEAIEQALNPFYTDALTLAHERNQNLGKFVENFASVVRVYTPQKQATELASLADKAIKLAQFEADKRGIVLQLVNQAPTTARVNVDPLQIEQILTNVVKNAMESIEADGHITITIGHDGRSLEVADNGAGLDDETSRLINDTLFYSSKPGGQGIGLMLTREILRLHETTFTLATDSKGTTRFSVRF